MTDTIEPPELAPVRPGEELDWPSLEAYLVGQLPELAGPLEVQQFLDPAQVDFSHGIGAWEAMWRGLKSAESSGYGLARPPRPSWPPRPP